MKHILVRQGTKTDLPAGGTIEGELRWCTDTHELYIDDTAGNILINKTAIVLNYKGVMDCSGIVITDYGFETWTNPTTLTYWTLTQNGTGGTLNQESGAGNVKSGTYSAKITIGTAATYIGCNSNPSAVPLRGSKVTLGVWCKSANTVTNGVKIGMGVDGTGEGWTETNYQNTGGWEYLTVTSITIPADATYIGIQLRLDGANAPAYYDSLSASPYPDGTLGDVYIVSAAGKIGGDSGKTVAIGDMIICNSDTVAGNEAAVGSKWDVIISAGLTTYELKLVNDADNMPVTTNIVILVIPSEKTGMNLINAQASVTTPSNAVVSYQIRNLTDGVDMLTTPITIDIGEYSSYTAVTPSVIDITKDDVFTADRIGISKTVAGTTEKGDTIILTFSSP